MKCLIKLSLCLFILFIFLNQSKYQASCFSARLSTKTKSLNHGFNEEEAKTFAAFSKYANCGKRPLTINCQRCLNPGSGYKMFFYYQFTRLLKYDYKFFIHYNDSLRQVIVSFAGPSVNSHEYIQMIYTRGWSFLKFHKVQIEREFKIVYFLKMRRVLIEKLKKVRHSGRGGYRFIFTGYSLGGSLATLAAFDLTKIGLINRHEHHPAVYTYGSLRIGDAHFVSLINSTLTLYRVVKEDDFLVRIPNCYYSSIANTWRCFTTPVLRKFIVQTSFPLRLYYTRYIPSSERGPLGKLMHISNVSLIRHKPLFLESKSKSKNQNNSETSNHPLLHHRMGSPNQHTTLAAIRQPHHNNNNNHQEHSFHNRQQHYISPKTVPAGTFSQKNTDSIIKTYNKYIFYTQPMGIQIFYNSSMSNFRRCVYVAGISNCEKVISLPTSFSAASHMVYYGIHFDQCYGH
jgi:hypothetical protein